MAMVYSFRTSSWVTKANIENDNFGTYTRVNVPAETNFIHFLSRLDNKLLSCLFACLASSGVSFHDSDTQPYTNERNGLAGQTKTIEQKFESWRGKEGTSNHSLNRKHTSKQRRHTFPLAIDGRLLPYRTGRIGHLTRQLGSLEPLS